MKALRFALLVVMLSAAVSMSAQLAFYAVPPCRVADTRTPNGQLGGPSLAAMQPRDFPVLQSACLIPSTAAAYSLNLTVVPHGFLGYLSIWPTGLNQPVVSTLNSYDGSIIANAAIVPAGSNGQITAFATDDTDLIIDVDGYFAFPTTGSQNINHGRTTATISQNIVYTFTVDWAFAFPDTNYTVTCTPQAANVTPDFYVFNVSAVNTSSVSVDAAAFTLAGPHMGGYPFNFTINCIGIHD